jgi:hypothetical protein
MQKLHSRRPEAMTFRQPSTISKTFYAALLLSAASLLAQTPSFVSFDALDTGTGTNQRTFPACMNDEGVIAGTYTDSALHSHGFVR